MKGSHTMKSEDFTRYDELDQLLGMLDPIVYGVLATLQMRRVTMERWRQDGAQLKLTWSDPAIPNLHRSVALWIQGIESPYHVEVYTDLWYDERDVRYWHHEEIETIWGVRTAGNGWEKKVKDATKKAICQVRKQNKIDAETMVPLRTLPAAAMLQ
jgi:hypothetical protein